MRLERDAGGSVGLDGALSPTVEEAWAWTGHGQIHGGLRDDCAAHADG